MGTKQFGRKVSLIIGQDAGDALDLSELRIVFSVQRGDKQTPNSLRVRVFNVSENTAQKVQKEFRRIVLQAGYEGNYGIIFDGNIKQVRRGRASQTDTYLDITAADGDSAYNFAIVNTTLAAGSTVEDHVKAAAASMNDYGVSLGYTGDLPRNPLPRGKVMFGMARDFMRGAARTAQSVWSIQDGKVQIIPETSYKPGEVIVITSETGLVGLPEQTQNGISFKMLLNPYVKISQLIKLDNASIQQLEFGLGLSQVVPNNSTAEYIRLRDDGLYYTMSAEHFGDTRGNDFYTNVMCLAADATLLPDSYAFKHTVLPQAVIPFRP